jgi:tetratricopeptide (TPR) repeat protein
MITALVLRRERLGRGPAAAVMIFCGMLFPALGFFNVYPMRFSYVADHFQYHASAALIALGAAMLCRWLGRWGRVVLVPLAALTFLQTHVYEDAETLWHATLVRNPDSWMVHTNLAKVLVTRGEETGNESDLDEAEKHYRAALDLDPFIHDTHANMGSAYGRRGLYAQAMDEYQKSLAINPNFAPAYYGIGQIYQHQGDMDRAIENFQTALKYSPNYPEAAFRLALALEARGDPLNAVEYYRQAVAGMPENAEYRYNLGNVLIKLRQFPEAVANFREAVRIRPGWSEAWTNMGWAELLAGHPQDAANSFKRALLIKPDLLQAQRGLQEATQR